jgi:hypothetical protein
MKPKMQSSASLFDKRGDRWGGKNRHPGNPRPQTPAEEAIDQIAREMGGRITRYQAEDDELRRQANYDDPEMDQFTKAKKAVSPVEYKEKAGTPAQATPQRRAFGNTITMRKKVAHHPIRIDEKPKPKAIETARAAQVAEERLMALYVVRENGTEEDHWKDSRKRLDAKGNSFNDADRAFDWYRGRKNVVLVEMWSNKTGELVKRWQRPLALGAKASKGE